MQAAGTQPGISLWAILTCVNKQTGYGSFTTLMNYPPVEGRTLEFYDTPEGNFSVTIIRVHESVKFYQCQEMKLNHCFGLADKIKLLPEIIEYQKPYFNVHMS